MTPRTSGSDALPPIMNLLLRVLRDRGHLTIMLADLGDRYGMSDLDGGIVVLDTANTDGEQRSTLAHELWNLAADNGTGDPADEDQADRSVAALLVPVQAATTVRAGADPDVVADRLGVDRQLVLARVRSLSTGDEGAHDGVG